MKPHRMQLASPAAAVQADRLGQLLGTAGAHGRVGCGAVLHSQLLHAGEARAASRAHVNNYQAADLTHTYTRPVQGALPNIPVLFTLGGVVGSFISTFLAYGFTR